VGWATKGDKPTVVESVAIWPLNPASVIDLVKAGILTMSGVNQMMLERAIDARWRELAVQ
jgi:hypothetical protein